jgi:hypothetical protein
MTRRGVLLATCKACWPCAQLDGCTRICLHDLYLPANAPSTRVGLSIAKKSHYQFLSGNSDHPPYPPAHHDPHSLTHCSSHPHHYRQSDRFDIRQHIYSLPDSIVKENNTSTHQNGPQLAEQPGPNPTKSYCTFQFLHPTLRMPVLKRIECISTACP